MYRAVVDLARKLKPSTHDNEGNKIGPILVLCNPEKDAANWEAVWKVWESAHRE
jgi:hypothetical protein